MYSTINPYKEFVAELSPPEFEKYCLEIIRKYAEEENLKEFHIEHDKKIRTHDGVYQIDIYVEFMTLNVKMKMLVECKQLNRPVGRDKVEVLANRLQSTGAQKGILMSTSGFQSGASVYAKEHGIALWQIMDESVKHIQNSSHTYTTEELLMQRKWRSYFPKIFVCEYDDYDYPMHQVYPTESMVKEARRNFVKLPLHIPE